MLGTLISKILVGAVVGYTTNDMAIQMLFRKRLGLGGIFLKTTEEFVENISHVVERDVLNHNTLHDELNTEAFEQQIEKTVREYLETRLFESVPPETRLADVPGIDQTFDDLLASFRASLPGAVEPLIGQLVRDMRVGDVISEAQLAHLSRRATELLLQKLDEYGVIQRFIRQFYQEVGHQRIVDLLSEGFVDELSLHGAHISEVFHNTLLNRYGNRLDTLVEKIYADLGVSELIRKTAKRLSQKQFQEILGEETIYAITDQLLEDTRQIVNSEQGEVMLAEFADLLIDTLEQEEKSVFELLSPDIQQNIRLFFREEFPPILDQVVEWLYSKQPDIEKLIDEAFGRNVDGRFKGWLIETFVGSVSQRADVIEKMVEIIRSYRENPERIARQLTQQIIAYLNDQSIGGIVKNLREQRSLLRFSDVLQKNVGDALGRLSADNFSHLFEKKLDDFFQLDQIVQLVEQNVQLLIERQLKDRLLYSRRASLLLSSTFQSRLVQMSEVPLHQVVSPNNAQLWSQQLEDWTLQVADRYQPTIEQVLLLNVGRPLEERTWSSIISAQQIADFSDFTTQAFEEYLQAGFQHRKQNQLHTYFKVINRIPDLHTNLSGVLRVALLENLETILNGRIESLVKSNLHRQSTAQIRDMVEKFMGQELKPITRLGALFGGMAGGVLAYLPNFQSIGLRWGVPALAYGLTGLGTNWIALRMIFRPYRKKYLPVGRMPVPLTPGVVVRRQARFANKMGDFVSDKLMNAEGLRDSFDAKKDEIQEFLVELLRKDDYAIVESFVERHKEELSVKVADTAEQFLRDNLGSVKGRVSKALESYRSHTLEGAETAFLEDQIISFLRRQETIDLLSQELARRWEALREDERPLDELLPENARERLTEVLENAIRSESTEFVDRLTEESFIHEILEELNRQIERYRDYSLSSLLKPKQQTQVQQQFAGYIYQEINNERLKTQVLDFVMQRIAQQVSPEKTIQELFGGELLAFLERNLDFVIQKIFESGVIWMQNNSEMLADRIYERAFTEQRAALLYKDTIRDTVADLIQEGIPVFVERERHSIRGLIGEEIERLGQNRIGQFNINFERPYIESIIENLVSHPRTEESVRRLTEALLRETFNLPLRQLLPLDNFAELDELQQLLHQELHHAGEDLQAQFRGKKREIFQEIRQFMDVLIADVLTQVSPHSLLHDFSEERLMDALNNLLREVFQSEAFETQLRHLLHKLIAHIKELPLAEVADWPQLETDLHALLEKATSDPAYAEQINRLIAKLVKTNMSDLNQNIATETKDYLVRALAASAMDALEYRLPDLLGSINIRDIVVEELNNMSPENLEFLFKGFAKKYLDELVRYGFGFGILFGLGLDTLLMLLLGLIEGEG